MSPSRQPGPRLPPLIKQLSERSSDILQVAAASIALLATIAVFLSSGALTASDRGSQDALATEILQLTSDMATRTAELQALSTGLEGLTEPADPSRLSSRLDSAEAYLGDLETRLSTLELAIADDPMRALQIPLVRRDVDNLAAMIDSRLGSMEARIDQAYDLSKWLLGALTVSILTLTVGTLLRGRSTER